MSANRDGVPTSSWVISVVDEFEGRLTGYALRLLRDEHAARDVVQHTFLRLCDADQAEIQPYIGQWLFRVCRNRSLDVLRKNRRSEPLHGTVSDQLPARDADPAELAEQQDLGRWVYQLLGELATSQREVLELWLNDFSYPQISHITGRSEGHVRVLAHRALSRLREHPRTRSLLATSSAAVKPAGPQQLTATTIPLAKQSSLSE